MFGNGGGEKEAIRPDFSNPLIIILAGAKPTSDVGSLLMREVDGDFASSELVAAF